MNRTHLFFSRQEHMMKSGAPPDKVRVLHHLLPIEFYDLNSKIDFFKVITLWFLVLSQFFIDGMGPFN